MHPSIKRISLLCASAFLLACTGVGQPLRTAADAEQSYLAGRVEHLARRPDAALRHYEAALMASPGHVNARNALAAWHAEHGDLNHAIALWEGLAGEVAGAGHGYVLSNLGYARFLSGDLARAQAALEQACVLDPLNHRAWHHLGNVLSKRGQRERAEIMYRQAAALLGHDFKSDYALVAKAGVSTIDKAVELAGTAPDDGFATTEIINDNGIFILRRLEAKSKIGVASLDAKPLLEITNGNGVSGMARTMARVMWDEQVVRLSNEKGFGVKRTRVEYGPAFQPAAERLARRIGASQLVPLPKAGRTDMRLVIGRDLKAPLQEAVALSNPGRRAAGG